MELHAVDFALHADDDGRIQVPSWVHVSPAGEEGENGERVVRGRDGREFVIDDPQAVIDGTELPAQFDWDHESMFFGSTRAAGWIDQLVFVAEDETDAERPAAGFWGRVERWTPQGRADIENGYFRGLSPVVRYEFREPKMSDDPRPPPLLRGVVNVALTNRPNLRMTLLHREETAPAHASEEKHEMTDEELAELLELLGLGEDADGSAILEAVRALQDDGDGEGGDEGEGGEMAARHQAEVASIRAELHAAGEKLAIVREERDDARAALKEIRDAEAPGLVDAAIAAGRAAPKHRARLVKMATHDREGFLELYGEESQPTPIVGQVTTTHGASKRKGGGVAELTERERYYFKTLKSSGSKGTTEELVHRAREMAADEG